MPRQGFIVRFRRPSATPRTLLNLLDIARPRFCAEAWEDRSSIFATGRTEVFGQLSREGRGRGRDWICVVLRGARAARPRRERAAGRAGRLPVARRSPTTSTPGSTSRARARSSGRDRRDRAGDRALAVGTGVTCPTMRTHPAIIAQAAATSAALLPGRFFLGVGTGENLNEHILGDRWPTPDERLEMLEEAVEVIRELWQGGYAAHRGDALHGRERARSTRCPTSRRRSWSPACGPQAAELAGRIGDALVSTAPDEELVQAFRGAGGEGKPCYGQLTVCWARTEDEAVKTAFEQWPNAGLGGELGQELAMPSHLRGRRARCSRPTKSPRGSCAGPDPGRAPPGDRRVRGRRLLPGLPPPGRPQPGAVLRFLRTRDSAGAAARSVSAENRRGRKLRRLFM